MNNPKSEMERGGTEWDNPKSEKGEYTMTQQNMLDKTAVVGAGLMGGQIGLILAMGSRETVLMSRRRCSTDLTLENLGRYADDLHRHGLLFGGTPEEVLARVRTTNSLEEAVDGAEFVVESVFEDLDVKREVFAQMDAAAPEDAILASNSSSIPTTKMAEVAGRPERIVGSHFVQPAHIAPVVEVIRGARTSDETVQRTRDHWQSLGKTPLLVKVDLPGFLVNRLQHAIIREAVSLLAKGIASAEDIDTAVSIGLGLRFTTAGPLEQRDINGIGTHARVAGYLWKELAGWEEPLAYLREKVDRGELGLDVGRGFYDWTGVDPLSVRRKKDEALLRQVRMVTESESL